MSSTMTKYYDQLESGVNKKQIGGTHYKGRKIQHWDYAAQLPYLEGQATKYIDRHARKNGKEDLLKAIHYLEKAIEYYYPEPEAKGTKPLPGFGKRNPR